MQRQSFLKTLSWEHHDGLVLALRLEKGLAKQTSITEVQAYVLKMWHQGLKHHFHQEEVCFKDYRDKHEEIPLPKMLKDHEEIRSLIDQIEANPDPEHIAQFAKKLRLHIRFEERQLFTDLEASLPESDKAEIASYLREQYRKTDKDWPVRFWE